MQNLSSSGFETAHLDLATVLKVSQSVSSEIVLEKLVETLLRTAIEHSGADRGLLILPRGPDSDTKDLQVRAEATIQDGSFTIVLADAPISSAELPEPVVQYAAHTQESVLLEDVSAQGPFSDDEYIRRSHARSILCIPLVKQRRLIALLYLENNLTANSFTPARIAVLDLLASAGAISLENSRLYREVQEGEANVRRLVDANIVGVLISDFDGRIVEANDAFLRIVRYTRDDLTSGRLRWTELTPPEWQAVSQRAVAQLRATGTCELIEKEYIRSDGTRVPVLVGAALLAGTRSENAAFVLDLTERKQAEQARQELEEQWRAAFESNPTMYFIVDAAGAIVSVNPFGAEQLGYTVSELVGRPVLDVFYEPDRQSVQAHANVCFEQPGRMMRWEARKIRKDGKMLWVRETANAVVLKNRPVLLVICEDITEQKRAEEALRRSEAYLAEAQKLTHTGSWAVNPDLKNPIYWSEEMFRIFGFDLQHSPPPTETFWQRVHPDDRAGIYDLMQKGLHKPAEYIHDHRIVLPDGTVKHIHAIGHAVLAGGEVVEIVGTSMDVTEQVRNREALEKAFEEIKALKDQLYKENLALRHEVDRAAMFEEIVGASPALQSVLARVAKVGPTESTVLISGETGTGKELVARAIHKRSRRSGRAFVSVNCAALAASLISSELFGHEKGAFTGATQRRLGRFELADGGTIFLDEVGELPPETQVALLRVLQEREFERVGGTQPVHVDVRVIAATNRDLKAATAAGTFRRDLFYRLNVFPIEAPPLRERKDDILMLIEYFVQRYARSAGKQIRSIDKETLELFQSYAWPGNIRELQNVVERSVILTSTDVLRVDESWLTKESAQVSAPIQAPPSLDNDTRGEREIIEAALTESRGRVAGPNGAAAKLAIRPSTLESRIKALNIRKSQFKFR